MTNPIEAADEPRPEERFERYKLELAIELENHKSLLNVDHERRRLETEKFMGFGGPSSNTLRSPSAPSFSPMASPQLLYSPI